MRSLIFTMLFISSFGFAQERKFECVASAILQMEFSGNFEGQELTSELMVNIEGSLFFIEKENVHLFSFHIDEAGNEIFQLSSLEKESNNEINLNTSNNLGRVITDYRGITLDNDLICFITNE